MMSSPKIDSIRFVDVNGTGRNGFRKVKDGFGYDFLTENRSNTLCEWARNRAEWCHNVRSADSFFRQI